MYVIILYSIISALFTIILNKNKFIDNLKNKNLLVLPNFLENDYLPNNETLKVINDYKNTPLTIISGKYIHEYNNNLQSGGYGLPILPLEHFNILNYKRKNDLIKKLFDLNSRHLVLCLYDCEFYKSNNHGDNRNKIFLGKNINYFKIFEKKNTNKKEILYLLKK